MRKTLVWTLLAGGVLARGPAFAQQHGELMQRICATVSKIDEPALPRGRKRVQRNEARQGS